MSYDYEIAADYEALGGCKSDIKKLAKMCLTYLKQYKKYENKSPETAEHCLDKAAECLGMIDDAAEKGKRIGDKGNLPVRKYAKFVSFVNEQKNKCINAINALGLNTSD